MNPKDIYAQQWQTLKWGQRLALTSLFIAIGITAYDLHATNSLYARQIDAVEPMKAGHPSLSWTDTQELLRQNPSRTFANFVPLSWCIFLGLYFSGRTVTCPRCGVSYMPQIYQYGSSQNIGRYFSSWTTYPFKLSAACQNCDLPLWQDAGVETASSNKQEIAVRGHPWWLQIAKFLLITLIIAVGWFARYYLESLIDPYFHPWR